MNDFITPAALALRIQKKTGIEAELAKRFSYEFFAIARRCLKENTAFIVHKFGTFKKLWVETSIKRNPRTNEEIEVPAHWRVKFIPSKSAADRINARYAHLKAKVLSGYDFAKKQTVQAESVFFKNDWPPAALLEDTQNDAEPFHEQDDDFDDDEENKKSRTPWIVGIIFLLLAVLLFILFKLLGSFGSGGKKKAEVKPAETKQEQTSVISEKTAPVAEISQNSYPLTDSKYTVPAGSCYYKIAEEQFENRHAWPLIYAKNAQLNPDPDLIRANATIFIPDEQMIISEQEKAKECYVQTYKAYYTIMQSQPENPKNAIRQFRAVRVLVSGEIMFPGFIEENKAQVSLEDYNDALAIKRNYVP
ncbi:HU family DNA-binding protein [Treponema parvum]|uniref:HU family DNA-binding protein n=1 Tax=Treponema parvum TaxID=138851 RepID=UPI001AEC47F1|nr:HU family DNA-binding protein [Treponema parvum]QTQ16097.1 HU family DNA-binding protein [Treponema parvum]